MSALHDGTADTGEWQDTPLRVRVWEFLCPWLLAAAVVAPAALLTLWWPQ